MPLRQSKGVKAQKSQVNSRLHQDQNALFHPALSGMLVSVVPEVARRRPAFGALIVWLPLLSLMGMIWLSRDTGDAAQIANHAESTFWYVLPPLPMVSAILRAGISF
jgi:hypothetical protein